MAINELWIPSPHYSTSRGPYNKIVFHTTEGAMKIRDLGAWFQNPAANCSSHHGADNYEAGLLGAYVYENHKAWTQGNANPYCLSLEMCAYASWSRDTWLGSKQTLLNNAADWLRYIQAKYNVPWTLLNNAQAQDPNARGICQHINFGSWGSGHVDCGSGFPIDVVIERAKGAAPGVPEAEAYDMTAAVAYDPDGAAHYACIGKDDGSVQYFPPGWAGFGKIDPAQSGARSGCTIAISDKWIVNITYVNASGHVCSYYKKFNQGEWTWVDHGGNAR